MNEDININNFPYIELEAPNVPGVEISTLDTLSLNEEDTQVSSEELFWEKDEVININPEDLIKAAERIAAIPPNLEPMVDTLPIQADVIDCNVAYVMEDEEVNTLIEKVNKLDKKYIPNWNDISGVSKEPELFTIGMHSSYFPMELEEGKLVLVGVSNSN